jgi:hypothetical protein
MEEFIPETFPIKTQAVGSKNLIAPGNIGNFR